LRQKTDGSRPRERRLQTGDAEAIQRPTLDSSHRLQSTQVQTQSEDEPGKQETQVNGPITNLRQPRPTFLLHEDDPDNEADSPRFQTGVQHNQTRRKNEKFYDIKALDELVQRRIQEVKLQFRRGPTQATAKVSDSPLSEKILECEFPKKFSILTFDYNSGASDPV